jgi:type I restriction enzyme R subunit
VAAFVSNFDFLKGHDPLLSQLALTAERSFVPDPNTTLVKLRQLGEALAQDIAARIGITADSQTRQLDLLRDIDYKLRLDRSVTDAFHQLRKLGNAATHDFTSGSHKEALDGLQIAWVLAIWFHRTFGGDAGKSYNPGKFVKPQDPSQEVRELEERIRILEAQQQRTTERLKLAEVLREAEAQRAEAEQRRAEQMRSESAIWEELAQEHEKTLSDLRRRFDGTNVHRISAFTSQPAETQAAFIQAVESTPLDLTEAETRLLIDRQLIEAGWIADSEHLRFSKGARPEPNRCKAIAEWPTASGPADYVLFDGLTPVAAIEAKKKTKDVHGAIDQAKRYARDFDPSGACEPDPAGWGDYRLPLVFATNGRPYLKQLEQSSGIWFMDVRAETNPRRVLQGWYTPEGIRACLKQNREQAEQRLDELGFHFDFPLRPYQREAISAVESAIKTGRQNCLVAMATGTGKTKTCIALIYRLLRAERFRRVLFLVDRSALGEQAADAFNETRMENLQTFAECFGIKELTDREPEDDTMVHIATVQGMVKRILYSDEVPGVDQYDCIVVDECHRGYLLDRELGETELQFRDQNDYISKYRRVLEYFDAVKIGLTATPALHTTNIFGQPVFTYSYPEAVVDGYLVDHLPPIRIKTDLSEGGIHYDIGEQVQVYQAGQDQLALFTTPDDLDFDIAQFNRQVLNDNFNREVCRYLVKAIDPWHEAKTLIFCATDRHADTVVQLLKEEYRAANNEVEDDAIAKITGQSDKPLELIRKFKNDRKPNIAVTVDLLTTGIDVPKICNLVFLRRVNSRILYEQMLGRATRRCDEIEKETFAIYDAVNLYDSLQRVNTMKPVVTDPNITFARLVEEMRQATQPELQQLARNQFLAKLNAKGRHLSAEKLERFETIAGMGPQRFVQHLKELSLAAVAEWFTRNPDLGELLDSRPGAIGRPQVVSTHKDQFQGVEHGYGGGQKPEDYLRAFEKFIRENSNRLPALQVVIQRPWELSRRSLKELAVELERHHFREQDLKTAWAELKNEEIAARIIGFIRQAALGEGLVPWETRVDRALETILALHPWQAAQKNWLVAVAKQMKATTIVDREALEDGVLRDQFGGLRRADKLFDGKVVDVLDQFSRALWQA